MLTTKPEFVGTEWSIRDHTYRIEVEGNHLTCVVAEQNLLDGTTRFWPALIEDEDCMWDEWDDDKASYPTLGEALERIVSYAEEIVAGWKEEPKTPQAPNFVRDGVMKLGVVITGPQRTGQRVAMVEHTFLFGVDGDPVEATILQQISSEGISYFSIEEWGWPGGGGWSVHKQDIEQYSDIKDCLAAAADYLLHEDWEPKGTKTCGHCGGPSHGRSPLDY